MSDTEPIRINVDVTNPGQFFACCGLLELADRLWPGAEGWFDRTGQAFCMEHSLASSQFDAHKLIEAFIGCGITNTMTTLQTLQRDELSEKLKQLRKAIKKASDKEKKALKSQLETLEKEKKHLDKLWRERPVVFGSPFNLQVDWFLDEYTGGSRFKTWAGQQSVIDIASTMRECITQNHRNGLIAEDLLEQPSDSEGVPFNFDSNLGPQASSVDVGYSLDALKVSTRTRPMIELCAFVGLQRFRPMSVGSSNLYRYRVWNIPLTLQVASIASCTLLPLPTATEFAFRLLYRTKYLKSFLPATQIGE